MGQFSVTINTMAAYRKLKASKMKTQSISNFYARERRGWEFQMGSPSLNQESASLRWCSKLFITQGNAVIGDGPKATLIATPHAAVRLDQTSRSCIARHFRNMEVGRADRAANRAGKL